MKKFNRGLIVVLILAIGSVASLQSCKKQIKGNKSTNFSIEKYEKLEQNYFGNEKYSNPRLFKNLWKAIKIGAADLGGAIGGFIAGHKAGGILDETGGGSGWDLGIGIAGATAGSITASAKAGALVISPTSAPTSTLNSNNPYEYVGENHNKTLYAIQDSGLYSNCANYQDAENWQLCKTFLISNSPNEYTTCLPYVTLNFLEDIMIKLDICNEITYSKIVSLASYPEISSVISTEANQVLKLYINTYVKLEEKSDVSIFVQYSFNMEEEISKDNKLSDMDKAFLLVVMSVARHSLEYWSGLE